MGVLQGRCRLGRGRLKAEAPACSCGNKNLNSLRAGISLFCSGLCPPGPGKVPKTRQKIDTNLLSEEMNKILSALYSEC